MNSKVSFVASGHNIQVMTSRIKRVNLPTQRRRFSFIDTPKELSEFHQAYRRSSPILDAVLSARVKDPCIVFELLENTLSRRQDHWIVSRKISRGLIRQFTRFNLKYFDGRLRKFQVYAGFNQHRRVLGECLRAERLILIRYDLARVESLETLLHEMIHIETLSHGRKFRSELRRLWKLGAPLVLYRC